MSPIDRDIDDLKAIGHGVLSLVNLAIILAIIAVVLAARSQSANIIATFFALLSWLVGQVINPITGGQSVALSNTLAPSGQTSVETPSSSGGAPGTAPSSAATPGLGTGSVGTGGGTSSTTTWVSPDYQTTYYGTNPPAGYLPADNLGTVDVNGYGG